MDLTDEQKSELCLSCMECCKILLIRSPLNPNNPHTRAFYEARGCRIITTDDTPLVLVPFPCVNLTEKGCKIYDNRPMSCRAYDGRKDSILAHICLWGKVKDA